MQTSVFEDLSDEILYFGVIVEIAKILVVGIYLNAALFSTSSLGEGTVHELSCKHGIIVVTIYIPGFAAIQT
jgi:hypothetical protein